MHALLLVLCLLYYAAMFFNFVPMSLPSLCVLGMTFQWLCITLCIIVLPVNALSLHIAFFIHLIHKNVLKYHLALAPSYFLAVSKDQIKNKYLLPNVCAYFLLFLNVYFWQVSSLLSTWHQWNLFSVRMGPPGRSISSSQPCAALIMTIANVRVQRVEVLSRKTNLPPT